MAIADMNGVLTKMKQKRTLCQNNMAALETDKGMNVQQVNDYTERLIRRIRELEKTTVDQINSKYQELSNKASADIKSLDGMIYVLEENLKKLGLSPNNQEPQVFVDLKLGQSHEAEGRKLLQQIREPAKASPKFTIKASIEDSMKDLKLLGSFAADDDIKVNKAPPKGKCSIKAKLRREYNIKVQEDSITCDSRGSCLLPDGTVMLADWNNNRLKRLNASYSLTEHCSLPGGPWGVTCTAPHEVAVTIENKKKVQFVSVRGSMSLTRSFSTTDCCHGICYSDKKLYVTCGGGLVEGAGHLTIYGLSGNALKRIERSSSGEQMFSFPCHVCVNPDTQNIYIADDKNGVLSFDKNGKFICSFTDFLLKGAGGVCLLDNGHILVCGWDSNNVLQFDGDGRKVTELLKATDGIKKPKSLCYDSAKSRLIVTMYKNDCIKVFGLV